MNLLKDISRLIMNCVKTSIIAWPLCYLGILCLALSSWVTPTTTVFEVVRFAQREQVVTAALITALIIASARMIWQETSFNLIGTVLYLKETLYLFSTKEFSPKRSSHLRVVQQNRKVT